MLLKHFVHMTILFNVTVYSNNYVC